MGPDKLDIENVIFKKNEIGQSVVYFEYVFNFCHILI